MTLPRITHPDDAVRAALARLADGGMVVVADDKDRENEGDLICAAEHMTHKMMAFFRRRTDQIVRRTGEARMPTDYGRFNAVCFRSAHDDIEHVALTMGDLSAANASAAGVLVRVHSECLTGDLFGSQRCDCGSQLQAALRTIAEEGTGAVIYLRGHEGRGIGLGHKLQAYESQDHGRDIVDANLDLGLPVDGRDYGVGAAILADLGVNRIRLITNNPHKYSGLGGHDLTLLDRIASRPSVTPENIAYLRTKRDRMGHLVDLPPVALA
ncbi:GTP cyclohydrolase II [Jatrophihabitans lederbergiae]|uniref:GTP cyclohydrolase-2 n=1 Tax=Jatrophihabitans lederbergiae TaxID=3075547 RepID=A0ABU2J924_9ACTN|nr:GTP cyclohydrolase II [Jatrophihabitans sp. DSM 44399]MDT0261480.1 GTP cyclohydrolase II [Jatrophihabitans sp. DSM 44399]